MTTLGGKQDRIFVALGGNLGTEEIIAFRFRRAIEHLRGRAEAVAVSSLYRSAPVGPVSDQPPFLNAVVGFELPGPVDPLLFLAELQALERALGRDRAGEERFGPRAIDLDLIACGDARMSGERLTLPHPRAAERAFVLLPLTEVAGAAYRLPGDPLPLAMHRTRPEVYSQPIERIAPPGWLLPATHERLRAASY